MTEYVQTRNRVLGVGQIVTMFQLLHGKMMKNPLQYQSVYKYVQTRNRVLGAEPNCCNLTTSYNLTNLVRSWDLAKLLQPYNVLQSYKSCKVLGPGETVTTLQHLTTLQILEGLAIWPNCIPSETAFHMIFHST